MKLRNERSSRTQLVLMALTAAWLSACGGGGGGGGDTTTASNAPTASGPVAPTPSPAAPGTPVAQGPTAPAPASAPTAGSPTPAPLPPTTSPFTPDPTGVTPAPPPVASAPPSVPPATAPAPAPVPAQAAGVPVGLDFTVNNTDQNNPSFNEGSGSIVRLANGAYAVVWVQVPASSSGVSGSQTDSKVWLKILGKDGNPVTADLLVATGARVPGLATGGNELVVTWTGRNNANDLVSYAQRYDAQGNKVGIVIPIGTSSYAYYSSPAMLDDGSIVVTSNYITSQFAPTTAGIFQYNVDGSIRSQTTLGQGYASQPASLGSKYVATWEGPNGTHVQLYDALGHPAATETRTNFAFPRVTALKNGNFIFTGIDGNTHTTYCWPLDGFTAKQITEAKAIAPVQTTAMLDNGGFVGAWNYVPSKSNTQYQRQILAQRYNETCTAYSGVEEVTPMQTFNTSEVVDSVAASPTDSGYFLVHGTYSQSYQWDVRATAK